MIDRRRFLFGAGQFLGVLAGTTFLPGCADYEIEIPCLGPAEPPAPVDGMTYIWASKIGCALNCDLRNGRNKHTGGLATDDAPRINAALANASPTNPITLIIDGAALISGLFLPAGGYWSIAGLGCGTGFFIKSGSNNDGIHNGGPQAATPSDPGPPAPPRGSNVSLSNFTINGNRGNGFSGNSTTGFAQGVINSVWYFPINLMNLNNIEVEKLVVVNSPSFHMRFSNVGKVKISGCVLRSHEINTDGLHFDGPANDVDISDCDITSGDDAIALNCPEGYSGDISRVSISNCKVKTSTFLVRFHPVYGDLSYSIDSVTIKNCTGICSYGGFLLGHGSGSIPTSINNVTISNCVLSTPAMLEIGANLGSVLLDSATLIPKTSVQYPGFALARSSQYSLGCTYEAKSLMFKNCIVQRSNDSSVVDAFDIQNGSSISELHFDGFAIDQNTRAPKLPRLINISSGTVGHLVINSVDSPHIEAPIAPGEFRSVGSVSGEGVLSTGWEFPDEVMADGVPYISASTGLPAIKIDGIVQPYSG